jgi:menaquinone-specific isochorismate synthase
MSAAVHLAAPEALVAWTVEVDDPGDLLSWLPAGEAFGFLRGGDGMVGWGVAARLRTRGTLAGPALADEVHALLTGMTIRDDVEMPGSGPVAFVSLTFDPATSGSVVVVPTVVLGRRDGRSWLTLVTPPGAVAVPQLRRRPAPALPPLHAQLGAPVPTEEQWADAVARAVTLMQAGKLDKVVLARALDVTADEPLDARAVASRLAARFPSCFTYVCDGLVGASPELLVRRIGRQAESLVLAGTIARGATAEEDAANERHFIESVKETHEHRLAVDSARDVLAAIATETETEGTPHLLRLANVTHLASRITAWLPPTPPTALDLAVAMHPTAAVGGTPRDVALPLIRTLEAAPRDRYAGPVGWMDASGDGEFALALRCAQLSGRGARLWAGCGIVAESQPWDEVAETNAKFDAVLTALTG